MGSSSTVKMAGLLIGSAFGRPRYLPEKGWRNEKPGNQERSSAGPAGALLWPPPEDRAPFADRLR